MMAAAKTKVEIAGSGTVVIVSLARLEVYVAV